MHRDRLSRSGRSGSEDSADTAVVDISTTTRARRSRRTQPSWRQSARVGLAVITSCAVTIGVMAAISPTPEVMMTQLAAPAAVQPATQPSASSSVPGTSPSPTAAESASAADTPSESASPSATSSAPAAPSAAPSSTRRAILQATAPTAGAEDGAQVPAAEGPVAPGPSEGEPADQPTEQAPVVLPPVPTNLPTTQPTSSSPTGAPSTSTTTSTSATTSTSSSRPPTSSTTTTTSGGQPAVGGRFSSQRSGLPWASGVHLDSMSPGSVAAFESWRGRGIDFAAIWLEDNGWSDLANPADLLRPWQGSGRQMLINVPMFPKSGGDLYSCAAGSYNQSWRGLGQVLSSMGFGNSVLRLGWEFNGSWYSWSAIGKADAYAGCWRQVVDSVRQSAPGVRWDWSFNRGKESGMADPRAAYPGDNYVDFVGISEYDHWPAATSQAIWDSKHMPVAEHGVQMAIDFARAHGKLVSIPEWGNRTVGGLPDYGGDNAQYVRFFHTMLMNNSGIIAYEAQFQAEGGQYNNGASLPNAAAAYKQLFGGG